MKWRNHLRYISVIFSAVILKTTPNTMICHQSRVQFKSFDSLLNSLCEPVYFNLASNIICPVEKLHIIMFCSHTMWETHLKRCFFSGIWHLKQCHIPGLWPWNMKRIFQHFIFTNASTPSARHSLCFEFTLPDAFVQHSLVWDSKVLHILYVRETLERVLIRAINRSYLTLMTGEMPDHTLWRQFLWQHITCIIKHKISFEHERWVSEDDTYKRRHMYLFHVFSTYCSSVSDVLYLTMQGNVDGETNHSVNWLSLLLWLLSSIKVPTFCTNQYRRVYKNVNTWRIDCRDCGDNTASPCVWLTSFPLWT